MIYVIVTVYFQSNKYMYSTKWLWVWCLPSSVSLYIDSYLDVTLFWHFKVSALTFYILPWDCCDFIHYHPCPCKLSEFLWILQHEKFPLMWKPGFGVLCSWCHCVPLLHCPSILCMTDWLPCVFQQCKHRWWICFWIAFTVSCLLSMEYLFLCLHVIIPVLFTPHVSSSNADSIDNVYTGGILLFIVLRGAVKGVKGQNLWCHSEFWWYHQVN